MKRADVVVFCLVAVVLLLGWAAWRHQQGRTIPLLAGTCEERCFANDAGCAAVISTQGGFPDAALAPHDRQARCNGICFVLRTKNPNATDGCLAR